MFKHSFTVEEYNNSLQQLKYSETEGRDVPLPLKENFSRLQGKAISIAVHVRYYPKFHFKVFLKTSRLALIITEHC